MNVGLIYSSKTGNTKKVAEAINNEIAEITAFASADNVDFDINSVDTLVLCYWVDKGTADKLSLEVFDKITGKKIITVGTAGVAPDSKHAQDVKDRVHKLLEEKGNNVIADFICMGKIDPRMTAMFAQFPEGHPHYMDEARRKRHEESLKHPDENDCANAVECVRKALNAQ